MVGLEFGGEGGVEMLGQGDWCWVMLWVGLLQISSPHRTPGYVLGLVTGCAGLVVPQSVWFDWGGGVRGGQWDAEMGAAACLAGTQKRGASRRTLTKWETL